MDNLAVPTTNAQVAALDARWLEVIVAIANKGRAYWQTAIASGVDDVHAKAYSLYNWKPTEIPLPPVPPSGDLDARIDRAFGNNAKHGQGIFRVFFNLNPILGDKMMVATEWRVYINVNASVAADVFAEVISLAEARLSGLILMAKINREEDGLNSRADGIVVYTCCENDARSVAHCMALIPAINSKLTRSTVQMARKVVPGISIGESPVSTQNLSFGDLRAYVLAAAIIATFKENPTCSRAQFIAAMQFWVTQTADLFGLSGQSAYSNAVDTTSQPRDKPGARSMLVRFQADLNGIIQTLNDHRQRYG